MSEDTLSQATPWSVLAQARAATGLSTRDVAETLNLSISVVQAIESGDESNMPAQVYVKGYVRAYAKLVNLDPEPLVAGVSPDLGLRTHQVDAEVNRRISDRRIYIGVGAGVVLALIFWLLGSTSDDKSAQSAVEQEEGLANQTTPPVVPAPSVLESEVVVELPDAPAANPVVVEPASNEAAVLSDYVSLSSEGEHRLELDFTEECWVEIKNSNGETLFADLGRPGKTFKFSGLGPFHVLLGYAPGAALRFDEDPVVLSPHTRNNVASVVLGQ